MDVGRCAHGFGSAGQSIRGAEVVGVWEKAGAMLHLPGPKRWTNYWLRSGAHLSVGDKVDVRVKSVDGPNKLVIVTLLVFPGQSRDQAICGLMIGTLRPGWLGCCVKG